MNIITIKQLGHKRILQEQIKMVMYYFDCLKWSWRLFFCIKLTSNYFIRQVGISYYRASRYSDMWTSSYWVAALCVSIPTIIPLTTLCSSGPNFVQLAQLLGLYVLRDLKPKSCTCILAYYCSLVYLDILKLG